MNAETAVRDWRPGSVEIIGLLVIAATVLLFQVPASSDGTTYLTWYASLSNETSPGCAGFEAGFCVISSFLSLIRFPEPLFLKFWSLLTYLISYLAVRHLVPDNQMRQVLPFVFLAVAFFIYLPLTITEHLTRQYIAGAIVAFGLTHSHRLALTVAVFVAGLFHTFSLMFLPIAIALAFGLRVSAIILLSTALLSLYVDWKVDLLNVLARLFEQIRILGEAWGSEYLKSIVFRFQLYWIGFREPFGYPETSFRGIGIFVFAYFALHFRDRQALRIVSFIGFIVVLWFVIRSNDLIAHRVYHYIRELAILPAVLTLIRIAQMLPTATRRLSPDRGTKEII